jgi:glycosyltransferase involved in cell wall biosynthesis
MRIAINTLAMKRKLYGGGNYIKNLVRSLSRLDGENEYLLLASPENVCHLEDLGVRFQIAMGPSNRLLRLPWEQTVLPLKLKQKGIDVYHGPAFVAPLFKTCGQVVSVHDMTFHLVPEQHSWHKRIYFQAMIPAMVRGSERVIAVSESTKRDILSLVPVPENKICVTHLGVDSRFQPVSDQEKLAALRVKHRLRRQFILFVGVIEPRKNIAALVNAYAAASLADQFDLVLAGSLGWDYSGLLEQVANSGLKDRIRIIGYVDDEDLPTLYSAAEVFVYPSLYEGFGLPPLEAMACGVPVITSSISSMPEIVGDAAILVNPRDVAAIASALLKLLSNAELREQHALRGRERARLFTWDRMAQKTLEVYESAAQVYRGSKRMDFVHGRDQLLSR